MTSAQSLPPLQREIDALREGETLALHPCEFAGPVSLRRAIVLDGGGATLWSLRGPVLIIESSGVVLRNLRVEVTGEEGVHSPDAACAILVRVPRSPTLENIEVRGTVVGLTEEEGVWRYPSVLQLGRLPHGREWAGVLRLVVPVPCRVQSNICGLEIEPRQLPPGAHELTIKIERLAQDTLLNGSILLSSAFLKRRIVVGAHIVAAGQSSDGCPHGTVAWEPPDWASLVCAPTAQRSVSLPVPQSVAPAPRSVVAPPVVVSQPARPVQSTPTPRTTSVPVAAPPAPAPPTLPPSVPISVPPSTAASNTLPPASRTRRVAGSVLGKLFSPPAQTKPAVDPEPTTQPVPPTAAESPPPAPLPSPPSSIRMKPASSVFQQSNEPPSAKENEPEPTKKKVVSATNLSPLFSKKLPPPTEQGK